LLGDALPSTGGGLLGDATAGNQSLRDRAGTEAGPHEGLTGGGIGSDIPASNRSLGDRAGTEAGPHEGLTGVGFLGNPLPSTGGGLAGETPALPEPAAPATLRPLAPGAFLAGRFEVLEVLSRGTLNLYLAATGSYLEPLQAMLLERADSGAGAPPDMQARLFPTTDHFVQDEREYLTFPWTETSSLADYRAPLRDEPCLAAIAALAEGLLETEERGLTLQAEPELLRFGADGSLCYYGFLDGQPAPSEIATNLAPPRRQLAELTSYLLWQVYGSAATIRLDDALASLPLTEELKELARSIDGDTASLAEIAAQAEALLTAPAYPLDVAMLTDTGLQRELNEDAALVLHQQRAGHQQELDFDLWAVSDGMGGHAGGEVASKATLTALRHAVLELEPPEDNAGLRSALLAVMDRVNAAVLEVTGGSKVRNDRSRPGATLVFGLRLGQRVFFGNVGDSRAYKWTTRDGLRRITRDHSHVQNLIDRGVLAEEDAWQHPEGSIITAHIGLPGLRQRDVFARLCSRGDRLLFVSDGVVDMLRDSEIAAIAAEGDAASVCRALVDAANNAGGADNITVICVVF